MNSIKQKANKMSQAQNYDEYKAEQKRENKKEKEFRKLRRNRKWIWSE